VNGSRTGAYMVGGVTVLDPLAFEPPDCVKDAGWCETLYHWTGNEWLASC